MVEVNKALVANTVQAQSCLHVRCTRGWRLMGRHVPSDPASFPRLEVFTCTFLSTSPLQEIVQTRSTPNDNRLGAPTNSELVSRSRKGRSRYSPAFKVAAYIRLIGDIRAMSAAASAAASAGATALPSPSKLKQRPRHSSPSDESVVSSGVTTELDSASASTPSTPTSARNDEPEPGKAAAGQGEDFLWMYTEEPHRSRRMAILKTHPEVRTGV